MKSKLYYKFKQKMQDNRGFTMAEVLTVVAILSILMAITFVAIFHYYQTLKLNEMDGTAKEIYIAAQNHLSYAKSTGKLDEIVKSAEKNDSKSSDLGQSMHKPSDWDNSKSGSFDDAKYRYALADGSNKILKYLLPSGSIDETVRSGNYIIEYNPYTAKVYGVFYSEKVAFSSDDEDNNFLNQTEEDTRVRPNSTNNGHTGRINYGKNNKETHKEYEPGLINGIIGYYGGSNINLPTGKVIDGITLSLKNDNKLTAEIRVPNYFDTSKNHDINYQYELHVRGKVSGVTRTFLLQVSTENAKDNIKLSSGNKEESYKLYHNITMLKADNDDLVIDFYLDDITKEGAHFSELGRGWIPGEDITAWVDISGRSVGSSSSGKVGVITGIKRVAAKDSVNSLFDYVKVNNGGKTAEVGIANFRNLENLDKQVSNLGMKYNAEKPYSQYLSYATNAKPKAVNYDITSAVQTKDLNWDDSSDNGAFVQWIRNSDNDIEKNLKDHKSIDDNIHVFDYDYQDVMSDGEKSTDTPGEHYNRTTENQYRSINLKKNATIKKKYSDKEEDETYTSVLKSYDGQNHQIKNLSIAGKSETENHAHDEDHPAGLFGTVDLSGDFAVKNLTLVDTNISAQSTAGAFIGKSDNTALTIEKVSAQSKDKSIESNNAVAGGLIGTVDSGNINVRDSFSTMIVKGKTYAGGLIGETHGSGSISNSYVGGHTKDGKYDDKNYNITADDGVAGGFIANVDNAITINNAYSTASVKGKIDAHAFTNRDLPDSCYAVGKYQAGNDEVKQDTVDKKFIVANSTAETHPYDNSIKENYPYTTVTTGTVDDRDNKDNNNKIYNHVGDWEVKKEDDKPKPDKPNDNTVPMKFVNGNKLTVHLALPKGTTKFTLSVTGLSGQDHTAYAPFEIRNGELYWYDFEESKYFNWPGYNQGPKELYKCGIGRIETAEEYKKTQASKAVSTQLPAKTSIADDMTSDVIYVRIDLDDLSRYEQYKYGPFRSLFFGMSEFKPGENITVRAKTGDWDRFSLDSVEGVTANSIFANGSNYTGEGENANTALIANARHLENLSPRVSCFDGNDGFSLSFTKAKQIANIHWISGNTISIAGTAPYVDDIKALNGLSNNDTTTIYGWYGAKIASNNGIYPVYNKDLADYNGGGYYIENIKIKDFTTPKGDENGSLFYKVKNGFKIENLNINNVTANATNTASGLIGEAEGKITVSNVKITGNINITSTNYGYAGGLIANVVGPLDMDNSAVYGKQSEVVSTGSARNVGGLIGNIGQNGSHNVTIFNSISSVNVRANTEGTSVGGAVGSINNTTNDSKIKNVYSAGHTSGGHYNIGESNVAAFDKQSDAGGLIGKINSPVTIDNCYSTSSVFSALQNAGGLIGQINNNDVVIQDSYATGLVSIGSSGLAGAFIGSINGNLNNNSANNYYLEGVNANTVFDVGGKTEDSGLASAASATSTVENNPFAKSSTLSNTLKFDATLPNNYPYRSVCEINGFGHIGDWPSAN